MIPVKYIGVWLKRFRKRCGYGVHSPFAFNLITGVVFERGQYYAFEDLDRIHLPGFFQRFSYKRKCLHFLFRLANYVHPDSFLVDIPQKAPELSYMKAACRHARWLQVDETIEVPLEKVLMYVDSSNRNLDCILGNTLGKLHPGSALLLRVHSNSDREKYIEYFRRNTFCGVTFDLYDYLLVFFDLTLYKQHYIVNFFD